VSRPHTHDSKGPRHTAGALRRRNSIRRNGVPERVWQDAVDASDGIVRNPSLPYDEISWATGQPTTARTRDLATLIEELRPGMEQDLVRRMGEAFEAGDGDQRRTCVFA
jgi:hypothetical protein